jgi:CheY-like chemotaxis protein
VLGDPTQLSQVLLNLCVNARDAMPHGGRLTLVVRNRDVDAGSAALHRATPGSYVELRVTDTGCGIPPEVLDRIFEPFFTTKEIGRGTGLGLSTALGIVRSHGGFVIAESQVGGGTSFAVCLPALCGGGTRDVPRGGPAGSLPRGDGELVLVVDDEVAILQAARQTLEAYGYRVLTATDGAHAIELFTRHRQKVAAVVTDVMMPLMDGATLAGALRRIDPDVRVIASSGLDATGGLAQVERCGARRFLGKPYSAQVLLQTLRSVLNDAALDAPGAP